MNVVDFFISFIDDCSQSNQNKSIMLTGGRSAKELYLCINNKKVKNTNFFLTDERNVPPTSEESNQKLIQQNFFNSVELSNKSIFNTYENKGDPELTCQLYESLIPDSIDLMLLSMGEDGHIASLFPNSNALKENNKKILSIFAPKPPPDRFTITPRVIRNTKNIIVLCFGEQKRKKYEEALLDPYDFDSIPARLVLDRNWVFDINQELDFFKK